MATTPQQRSLLLLVRPRTLRTTAGLFSSVPRWLYDQRSLSLKHCKHGTREFSAPASSLVLEQAREAARDLGFEPAEAYDPFFSLDVWQQALMALQGFFGDSTLAVVAGTLLLRVLTWPWNRKALQRQCDRLELLPIYASLVRVREKHRRAASHAAEQNPKESATVRQAEAGLARAEKKLEEFQKETCFNPLQGMGYQWLCVVPLSVHGYLALRGMMAHPDFFQDFVITPTLWLDSLVLTDPYGALPVASALTLLANMELNSPPTQAGEDEETALYMRFAYRGAVLTFVPVTALLPSAALVFITTNAAYTAVVTWAFRSYAWEKPRLDGKWRATT